MRKQLTVALGLAVLATPAFASKARLQALGEDVNGSQYINDNRNIWLNTAQLNNHADLVTYEWGNGTRGLDAAATPRGEGGVFRDAGNLVYGVQFNGASNTANLFRDVANLTAAESNEENVLDAFVAGDAGLKWGANLSYSREDKDAVAARAAGGDKEKAQNESMRARLGVVHGASQAYANLGLINTATDTAGREFKGKTAYQLGAIHDWGGNSFFVEYVRASANGENVRGEQKLISTTKYTAGVGRITRLNDKANLFTRVSYVHQRSRNGMAQAAENFGLVCNSATQGLECKRYLSKTLPAVVGLEVDAASWLTLRGSVSQNLLGNESDKKDSRSVTGTTAVNAGATVKFGELSLDGLVGASNDADVDNVGANTATGNGALRTDHLMTRVSMTYRF